MKRLVAAGAAVALTYVGAVLVTSHFTSRTVRPLFDAVGPPPVYRWVKPPPDFAAGNIKPKSTELTFGLTADALPPAGASEDSQLVFNLPKASIPAHEGDLQGVTRVEPTNPDSLGPLPGKQFADGNAYKITFRYETTGSPAPVTLPGSVLLTVPVPAEGIVYSEDGKTWRTVKSQHASATAVGGELPGAGYYLAVTPDVISSTGNSGVGRLLLPIGITVLVAAGLVITPLLLRRGRTPATRQARRQAARRR